MVNIFDCSCPECGTTCWVNNGDISDFTIDDVEAIRCWKCQHEFIIDPEVTEESINDLLVHATFKSASLAAGGDNFLDDANII